MKLIRENGLKTEQWNSGSTTEIMIYPPGSMYSNRQFQWRVSLATIEEEQSIFTKLDGYKRTTMVLEGNLTLIHENQYTVHLKPFEQDCYQGDWYTISEGKVTNLNLITDNTVSSSLKVEQFFKQSVDYAIDFAEGPAKDAQHLLMALVPLEVRGDKNISLNKGDFLYVANNQVLNLYAADRCIQFIHIKIEC